MDKEYNAGSVKISEEVLAGIVNVAACEVDGVVKLVSKGITNAKTLVENFKSAVKGVSIATTPAGLEITLQIAVKQGCKMQKVANEVQINVAEAVRNMSGLEVSRVNVVVVAVIDVKVPEKEEDR
ncbi:MAG: Asp23/Gls24 family envelope stress response protein [Clostridiales bacterium]|nr:MAG: Asp23/Gls24 family envelope stress response protein [Clostridiales bacterium]